MFDLPYKKVVIDIDGTLCEDKCADYMTAVPNIDVITKVNKFYYAGFHVTLFTARGMHRFNGDGERCDRELRAITEEWLDLWSVRYHVLKFGKPSADIYVDDKALRPDEFANKDFGI